MTIACLSSDTTYDVQCPVCGRGFLFLIDEAEITDRGALRRMASAALAAQHSRTQARPDRRRRAERRTGRPDLRTMQVDRRRHPVERRSESRRAVQPEALITEQERRAAEPTFRRGSGAAHPKNLFYLQGWDGDRAAETWPELPQVQQIARC